MLQPCGGAIPLCMVDEFDLPADIIDRKVTKMKMISPSNREVDVGKTLSQTEYIGAQLILTSYVHLMEHSQEAQMPHATIACAVMQERVTPNVMLFRTLQQSHHSPAAYSLPFAT